MRYLFILVIGFCLIFTSSVHAKRTCCRSWYCMEPIICYEMKPVKKIIVEPVKKVAKTVRKIVGYNRVCGPNGCRYEPVYQEVKVEPTKQIKFVRNSCGRR